MEQQVITQFSGTSICLTNPSPGNGEPSEHIYAYDYLYDMESASESVFTDMALPLCEGLFEGFNGTIFAYGQTGSGKTHSMMGNAKDPGVIPRVAIDVFERANNLIAEIGGDRGGVVRVMASYIQIYREVIQDLLGDLNADLKIRRDPKFGTYVQGLSERKLDSADGLTHVIEQGNKKRAVAATLMNSESSRSHAVVIIRLEVEYPADVLAGRGKKRIGSKINLVDLAGSERASKTGATGETLKEAIAINQSLSALGNVINALSDPRAKGHIPYRSSKLTHLLEESLGGNSHTVMLAAIGPAARNFAETLQTLQYASRAKEIKTNAKANAFSEELKGASKFGAEQAAALAAAQADMAAQVQAAQEQAQEQMAAMLATLQSRGGASSEELGRLQDEMSEVKASLAAAQAVAELMQSQLDNERSRADEAERQKNLASESQLLSVEAIRNDSAEALRRVEAAAREREQHLEREVDGLRAQLADKAREAEAAAREAERQRVDSLEGQVLRAQLGEEVKSQASELHSMQLKHAGAEERMASLERELEIARGQLRQAEAQRDQSAARETVLEEQKASAEVAAASEREAKEAAQEQLQKALAAQVEMQRQSAEGQAASTAAELAGSLAVVQQTLQRLEQRSEQQASKKLEEGEQRRQKAQEEELKRLDSLLQAQASSHASAIEQLERRASAEASRLGEAAKRAAEQHQQQLSEMSARLREAMESRIRLQSDNATRKAAADALGERVAMLQDQLASLQLDLEQQRHVRIAERAELEEAGRAKTEELEAMRVQVLQHTHEADGLKAQIRERDESLARRAERLRQLQALYERALLDKQRVEEAAWAERQELHEERRSLELRVREEAGRAQQAIEYVQRSGGGGGHGGGHGGDAGGGGLLSRLFNGGGGGSAYAASSPIGGKAAWAERPAPESLTDSQRMPLRPQARALLPPT